MGFISVSLTFNLMLYVQVYDTEIDVIGTMITLGFVIRQNAASACYSKVSLNHTKTQSSTNGPGWHCGKVWWCDQPVEGDRAISFRFETLGSMEGKVLISVTDWC